MQNLMKVVSGGQTGVDRAALDVAMEHGFEIGGWCPRGRWAEDGSIPQKYPLSETRSSEVHVRTQRNVEASTATLVITRGSPMGGTRLTVELAQSMRRPLLVVDLSNKGVRAIDAITEWLFRVRPAVLNVAGPRESGAPGITAESARILDAAFERVRLLSDRSAKPRGPSSRRQEAVLPI